MMTSRAAVFCRKGLMWRGWTYVHQWRQYFFLLTLFASTISFVISALAALKSQVCWWRFQGGTLVSAVYVLVVSEGQNYVQGRGECQLKFCYCLIGITATPRLTCHFSPLIWKIWGGVQLVPAAVRMVARVGAALLSWNVLKLVCLPIRWWGCCCRTFRCDSAWGQAWWPLGLAILGAALSVQDLNLLCPLFCSSLIPNGCGPPLVIGLTSNWGLMMCFTHPNTPLSEFWRVCEAYILRVA